MEIFQISDKYIDYNKDESKFVGNSSTISFPTSCGEVVEIFNYIKNRGEKITAQGSRTGLVGAGVGLVSHTMSFEKMNKILATTSVGAEYIVKVQSGVTLGQLREHIKTINENVDFLPNPTEETATFGGLFSHNAKGMNSLKYGGVANHINSVKILFSNGDVKTISCDEKCSIASSLAEQTTMIELLAGSEGQLGLVLELDVILRKTPSNRWGVMFFFNRVEKVVEFKNYVNNLLEDNNNVDLSVFEYYDKKTLDIVGEWKKTSSKLKSIPDYRSEFQSAIYLEIESELEEEIEVALMEILDKFEADGGAESDTWAGVLPSELEKFQHFRHAVQEGGNSAIQNAKNIDSSIFKLSMDFKLQDSMLEDIVNRNVEILKKSSVEYFVFGHIGENHLQLNLLPNNVDEFQYAKNILADMCEYNIKNGGTNFVENGVGKTRINCLNNVVNKEFIDNIKKVKEFFDKESIFNC